MDNGFHDCKICPLKSSIIHISKPNNAEAFTTQFDPHIFGIDD